MEKFPNIETATSTTSIEDDNPNLTEYLNREGAFILPPISEQRQLMEIFINKIYPFFPVIEISDNKDSLNKFPPLLLNAIFSSIKMFTSE